MQSLPPLAAGDIVARLPLSESSAAGLLAALLDGPGRSEQMVGVLWRDPSLTIWTSLHPLRRRRAPRDLHELAAWLAEHAFAVLDWRRDAGVSPPGGSDEDFACWRRRSDSALKLADAAAGGASPHLASRIRLVAFLRNAVEWLFGAAMPHDLDSVERLVPSWLRQLLVDLQSSVPHPDPAIRAVQESRLSASAAPRREDSAPPSVAAALPRLAEKLARLERLETDFAAALQREKLASLQKLAYGASHEINNPLANISARAQTLLIDETDPERRRALATINDQALRAFEMIANMMLFAKPPDLNLAETDACRVVAKVIGELTPVAGQQGTALRSECDVGEMRLLADETQLGVLVKALCRNALEAAECGGEATITLHRVKQSVRISVHDTGPGLGDEARRHLFDPFYSGREAGRGLGFGLSWCWTIVEAHGGEIAFESGADKGTTFIISLPLAGPESAEAPAE
ncbi:MAG: HAMP domain-containing histidine kinase [Planctomycetes bacterium]|nr:HAMP domain-containing histidine kinase [Planctomycetota bacterium]